MHREIRERPQKGTNQKLQPENILLYGNSTNYWTNETYLLKHKQDLKCDEALFLHCFRVEIDNTYWQLKEVNIQITYLNKSPETIIVLACLHPQQRLKLIVLKVVAAVIQVNVRNDCYL